MYPINWIKSHYYDIPDAVLKFCGSIFYKIPRKYRYGKVFYETTEFLKHNEHLSQQEINEMVDKLFINTVTHAYNHVPFYKKFYDKHGINITSIKSISDIDKLPFIDKQTLLKHTDEMIADDIDKANLMYITTSGSTGNPVGFYQPQEMTMIEWAYTLHIWGRVGYNPESSRLVLRGKKIRNQENCNWNYDPLRRELSCNNFDLNDDNIELYISLIEKYKPEFIHGYMSAILVIAKYIDLHKVKLTHKFKAILATSENIISEQRDYVEKIFDTRVFSFYGHSERLIIAGECETSHEYHVEPSYGYCEIINNSGKKSSSGEIVATGFLNYAMPLIRYRTGDIAVESDNKCNCHRKYNLIKEVTGRWHQDMLINSDGAYVSLTALNIHSNELDKIKRYKIIQDKEGIVTMNILPIEAISQDDIKNIKATFEEKTRQKILFNIKIVDKIPLPKNGKYRIIEQNIKN